MRTTLNLDDDLVKKAMEMTGIDEKGALVRYAVKRLIEAEAAKRLARLGGTVPDLQAVPRRRFGEEE